jgi:2-(1,2-epoxy-1,2-dihydrophenyl)acetyl-CoA isomerase
MSRFVRQHLAGEIATITLDHPQRHNSLVPVLLDDLTRCFNKLASDSGIKVLVLRASGRSFSTGGDLAEFWAHRHDLASYASDLVGKLNDTISWMIECEKTILVAVDGQVCGGALGLVLGGDIVLVSERASFTPYYVDVGFSPDGGWTALLPEIIGPKRACALQMLNDSISPQQALDWGLASAMVKSAELDTHLDRLCSRLLSKKTGSLHSTKRLARNQDFRRLLEKEREAFVRQVVTDEALSGIKAFVNGAGTHT